MGQSTFFGCPIFNSNESNNFFLGVLYFYSLTSKLILYTVAFSSRSLGRKIMLSSKCIIRIVYTTLICLNIVGCTTNRQPEPISPQSIHHYKTNKNPHYHQPRFKSHTTHTVKRPTQHIKIKNGINHRVNQVKHQQKKPALIHSSPQINHNNTVLHSKPRSAVHKKIPAEHKAHQEKHLQNSKVIGRQHIQVVKRPVQHRVVKRY